MKSVAAAAVATLMVSGSAGAVTKVFNSYGPGQRTQGGDCITGTDDAGCFSSPTAEWIAAPFVPSASGTLDYIHLATFFRAGTPGFVVSIVADNGGSPTGITPVLETFVITKTAQYGNYVKYMSKAHPTLTAGKTYWLVMSPLAYDSDSAWSLSPTDTANPDISTNAGLTWGAYSGDPPFTNMPAFDIFIN